MVGSTTTQDRATFCSECCVEYGPVDCTCLDAGFAAVDDVVDADAADADAADDDAADDDAADDDADADDGRGSNTYLN